MSRANAHALFRTFLLTAAAAVFAMLAACSGPDPTKFSCSSSLECPSGYHCDLGTASAAGSLKCQSGAPQPKTITVDATRFLLSRHPSSDGSVRTTVVANVGAVRSAPDFVGVKLIASQAGVDLASSAVVADGSALEFQLPQALAQVSLRVQDDGGHSVTVTGYPEEVELSFVGKEVAGSANAAVAYDVTNQNDSLFPPAAWLASGPGPVIELDSNSYAAIAYADYTSASTSSPPIPSLTATAVGWQSISQLPTTAQPSSGPTARTSTSITGAGSGFVLFGGLDAAGSPADAQGAFWQYDFFSGWTPAAAPAGQVPTARSGAAAGRAARGGSCLTNSFVTPCDVDDYDLVVAGGAGATGTMTNEIQLYDHKRTFTSFSLPPTVTTSWKLIGSLPFANAGMESAAGYIPLNVVVSGSNTTQSYSGGMMIYGRAVTPANSGTQGCVLFAAAPQTQPIGSAALPIQPVTASCVGAAPSVFDQTTGGIGFRTGATLVSDGNAPTNFYLFGGRKTTGATTTGLTNDLWKATITCPAVAGACTTTTTWTQLSAGGTVGSFPTPRAGAGGAIWTQGRLVIHGGTDANGPQNDLWEWDFGTSTWRQDTVDSSANVLSPATRTGFSTVGGLNQQHIFTFGGALTTSGALTDEAWLAGHESAAKLLLKLPFNLPALDQARNIQLTLDALGISGLEQAFVWDGTTWRFFGAWDLASTVAHVTASTIGTATGLIQPDGNIYVLFIESARAQFNSGTGFSAPVTIDRVKLTVEFQ